MNKLILLLLLIPFFGYAQFTKPQLYTKIDAMSAYQVGYMKSLMDSVVKSVQLQLVSGTNIKTLESQSLLGSGNIDLVKSDVGLGNVDNTSDTNKPISTATQTELDTKSQKYLTPVTYTSSHTLDLTDIDKMVVVNTTSGSVVLTIPDNGTTAFTVGTQIPVLHVDSNSTPNTLTFSAAGSATINAPTTSRTSPLTQAGSVIIYIYKNATNAWDLSNGTGGTGGAPLPVASGGTGAATLTGALIGNGTSNITAVTGTANQYLRRNAGNTAYEFGALPAASGDVVAANPNTFTNNNIFQPVVTTGTGSTAGLQVVANSLTTGNNIDASSSSTTTGAVLAATNTSTVLDHTKGTHGIVDINVSGTNSTSGKNAIGLSSVVTNTQVTSGTNIAGFLSASGATTDNLALQTVGNVLFGNAAADTHVANNNRVEIRGTSTGTDVALYVGNNAGAARQQFSSNGAWTQTVSGAGIGNTLGANFWALTAANSISSGNFMSMTTAGSFNASNNTFFRATPNFAYSGSNSGGGLGVGVGDYGTANSTTGTVNAAVFYLGNTTAGSFATNAAVINVSTKFFNGTSSYNPNAGSGNWTGVLIDPIINQTGSASGLIRGIYYNPTPNAVLGTHNFLESTAGNQSFFGKTIYNSTITPGGTTGNRTIDKPSGTVNIAALGTTVTVTNSFCTPSSIVIAVIRTNDTTAYVKNVVPGSGSFVINLGVAATAEISIGFIVHN